MSYSDLFETFHFDDINYQCTLLMVNLCNQLTGTLSLEMVINQFQIFHPVATDF